MVRSLCASARCLPSTGHIERESPTGAVKAEYVDARSPCRRHPARALPGATRNPLVPRQAQRSRHATT